ncbi:glycosyltransferase family protein [Seonamhaeicola marinus]|uniref:UDP-glycosyltransferase n=1 Tax=Seonamhaeicola marinus TaxID=1912246 RepID=A0A5D0HJG6_9FLAO|nr:hypothetical protein [Seonamhaeicola marinus]TYA71426.1 hypothetical protein FUA24_17735 [Seonamhaeicola marinus]
MNKLVLVITDGVGFKNYVLSDFLKEAIKNFEEVIIFSALPKSCYDGFLAKNCSFEELEDHRESGKTWFYRKLKEVAHLQNHKKNNFGIRANLKRNYPKGNSKRAILIKLIFIWTRYFYSEKFISKYQKLQETSLQSNSVVKRYLAKLEKYKPDIIYFTHQRPAFIAPLIYASKKLDIPSASFIFSWDNLASKGRMAGDFDYYFVWSNLMKEELLEFYSSVKAAQVKVVGTPQFEPYVLDRYNDSKAHFNKKFSLSDNYKTICYSCGDVSTSKNDALYVRTIAEAMASKKITKGVNFIVRTSPAEEPTRFEALKEEYPFIQWNYPKWKLARNKHQEIWSQRVPEVEDVSDLRSILAYSDVMINMCSTMSLDAMFFDKPVINPVFGNAKNGLYDDQKYLEYRHYNQVVKSGAVNVVKDANQLIEKINELLTNPNAKLKEQHELLKVLITGELSKTGERIVNAIKTSTIG